VHANSQADNNMSVNSFRFYMVLQLHLLVSIFKSMPGTNNISSLSSLYDNFTVVIWLIHRLLLTREIRGRQNNTTRRTKGRNSVTGIES